MDKNQKVQKFNGVANIFTVFAKAIEKSLAEDGEEKGNFLICGVADMLISEINEIKNAYGCEINN